MKTVPFQLEGLSQCCTACSGGIWAAPERAGRPTGTRGYPLGNGRHLQGQCPSSVMVTILLHWRSEVEEQEDF